MNALQPSAPRRLLAVGLAGVCLAGNATPIRAQASAPAQSVLAAPLPLGRSQHDLLREIDAFDEQFVVKAYEQVGHRDPRWDADALKLIRAQKDASIYNTTLGNYYVPIERPLPVSAADRAALADRVIDAGCDDPMVLFLAAHAIEEGGGPRARVRETFARADALAGASGYVPLYKLLIFDAAMKHGAPLDDDDPAMGPLRERFREMFRQALADPQTLPAHRAVVWSKAAFFLEDDDKVRSIRIATEVANVQDPDPWLFDTYMGHVEIQRAWTARGGGWAASVTDDGWKGFNEHLAKARERLERASALDPTLPHAPAYLVTVALGQGSDDAERWFREAIGRQVDHMYAWGAYRSIVQPRWGGSVARQLRFAQFAIDTGRFDTRAPAVVLDVADDLERDNEGPLNAVQLVPIGALVDRAMGGYADREASPPSLRAWAASTRVVWAVLQNRWKQARALMDALPALQHRPAAARDLDGTEIIGQVYAMTHPRAAEIRAAIAEADPARRVQKLAALSATLQPDEAAAGSVAPQRTRSAINWLDRRLAETRFEASLVGGAWTPLPIDPELTGWTVESGTWRADGVDAIVGAADGGLSIVAPFQLPDRYEFRCTIESVGEVATPRRSVYVYPAWSPAHRIGAFVPLNGTTGNLIREKYNHGEFPLTQTGVGPSGNGATVCLRYDRGVLSAVDEQRRPLASKTFANNPIRRPAFGGLDDTSGVAFRFSAIQVRSLR